MTALHILIKKDAKWRSWEGVAAVEKRQWGGGMGKGEGGRVKSCHNSILGRSMPFHLHVELQQVDAAEAHHKSPNFECWSRRRRWRSCCCWCRCCCCCCWRRCWRWRLFSILARTCCKFRQKTRRAGHAQVLLPLGMGACNRRSSRSCNGSSSSRRWSWCCWRSWRLPRWLLVVLATWRAHNACA